MGNKKKLISKGLIHFFPQKINTFIDLFAGSGIVSMNVEAGKYIINDIDSKLFELYCLFKNYKSDVIINLVQEYICTFGLAQERTKRNVYHDIEKIKQYKEAYAKFRDEYNNNPNSFKLLTLMFYSFSQQMRFNNKGEFNMPCGNDCFSENNKSYIVNGCNFFGRNNVSLSNRDFRKLKISNLHQDDFIYIDPPYFNTTATYNENGGWNIKYEQELYQFCEALIKTNIKFAMSNVFRNKGVENTHLINWVKKNNFKVNYFDGFSYMACGKGNAKTVEVLIMNY